LPGDRPALYQPKVADPSPHGWRPTAIPTERYRQVRRRSRPNARRVDFGIVLSHTLHNPLMRFARLFVLLSVLFGAVVLALSRQDKFPDVPTTTVTTFKFAGGDVGTNTFTESENGDFTSITQAKIGPQAIQSTLTGHRDQGKIVVAKLKQSEGATSI